MVRPAHFLRSPAHGLFEPGFTLGEHVTAGGIAGWLHDPERPLAAPHVLRWPGSGLVICRPVPAPCAPGDVLAHLTELCDRAALLSR